MARTILASGTITTDGTEQTIRDETGSEGKVLDAYIDLGLDTVTETIELRVYTKVLTGGTLRRIYYQKCVGAQDDEPTQRSPIIYIPAISATTEWKLTIKKTAGTNRAHDWKITTD